MLWCIFAVAVLNIGIGFAVAVHLGKRHRESLGLQDLFHLRLAPGDRSEGSLETSEGFESPEVCETPEVCPEVSAATAAFDQGTETAAPTDVLAEPVADAGDPEEVEDAPQAPPDEEALQSEFSEPATAEAAPPVAVQAEPDAAEAPSAPKEEPESELDEADGERDDLEKALAQWQDDVQHHFESLSRAGDDLRELGQAPEPERIEGCLNDLRAANQRCLQIGQEACQSFTAMAGERHDLGEVCEGLQAASDRQAALIQDTNQAIEGFDYRDDLPSGCDRMIARTDELMQANREVRDALEAASLRAQRGAEPDETDPAVGRDTLAGLAGAADLEASLHQWWQEDPERTRNLGVAVVDVDHFAQVNERHGRKVGNKILEAVAQLLKAEGRGQDLTARMAGEQFVCLFYDGDLQHAIHAAERIRQRTEAAVFQIRGVDVRVTVSCGVTEATAEDTPETFLARARATLEQAKRYGHNRGFSHDGTFPVPVPAPAPELEPNLIPL